MQILDNIRIKKMDLTLRAMLHFQRLGYSNDEIIKKLLHFEKKFDDFYCNDEDIARVCDVLTFNEYKYGTLLNLPYYKNHEKYDHLAKNGNNGGAFFAVTSTPMQRGLKNYVMFDPVQQILKEKEFDMNRIEDLVKIFDLLVDYGMSKLIIGKDWDDLICQNNLSIEELINPVVTVVPEDFSLPVDYKDSTLEICKTFSDVNMKFKDYKQDIWDIWKKYKVEFETDPNWIISGSVEYYYDKTLYLGLSSPHTEFEFYSKTLYPDFSKIPSKEELYSPNQVKSLTFQKNSIKTLDKHKI